MKTIYSLSFALLSFVSFNSAKAQSHVDYFSSMFPKNNAVTPESNLLPTAAPVTLDSTTLPIVYIYTNFQLIWNEPKITAAMGIINNGYMQWNHVTDSFNDYLGYIGIETRGNISQLYPQKSYGFETRDSLGNNLDTSLLGMPQDNDWILYGPYDDRTLMKNVMTFELGRQMGYWAPRCKLVELIINYGFGPDYRGVYVLMEKIKRDNNRVDIAKLDLDDNAGDSVTGGYILAIDSNFWTGEAGFNTLPQGLWFSFKYPNDTVTPQQAQYIEMYVDSFEFSLSMPNFADLQNGYRKYCYENSFMDYFFFQEMSKNIDAYKRSNYLCKDKFSKGGKLQNGPLWDYNSAWGINACTLGQDTGWVYNTYCWPSLSPIPFWYPRMLQDSIYARDLHCRWITWRSTVLDTNNIFNIIDSIAAYLSVPATREYTKYDFTENYQNQVDSFKTFIRKRLIWMDANMPGNCWNLSVSDNTLLESMFSVFPNPFNSEITLSFYLDTERKLKIDLYNTLGQQVKSFNEQNFLAGSNSISLSLENIPPGIYYLQVSDGTAFFSKKIVKVN